MPRFFAAQLSNILLAVVCSSALAATHPTRTAPAPQAAVLSVDATSFTDPAATSFRGGSSTDPNGQVIGMNDRYLTLNGKPWLPAMGEFHYSRVPEAQWEPEILKMKAAGVSIIATYIIWIHHEEVEGEFDWKGRRDLRRFVELCGKHGMFVNARIGPWAHGEARNGGFPDWLLKKAPNTRENDPTYLSYVAAFYDQIGQQLKGLLWKDGGPVIGIQLENEYARRGSNAGEAHIIKLKEMAISAGLDVPIYSVTGWGNAAVPHGRVVAVFGGYPDAPWDDSISDLPPQEVYAFRLQSRVTGNMGAIGGASGTPAAAETHDYPFITAEMGGGMQDTYHRRPVIQPDDIAAMVPVMLGSGVNLYGTYMFQGGENPDGKLTTLQESQATHYPTDVPEKSYDFQAPLSEFGQEREVFRKLKVFNYFMQDFGPSLAPMTPHAPNAIPVSPQDLSIPRVMVRSDDSSGFLFFNNYVRGTAMPARKAFQVRVTLPHKTIAVPDRPIDLPSGAYGIWPISMQIGTSLLRYATAQPFARVLSAQDTTYYFIETKGVAPTFVWDTVNEAQLKAPGSRVVTEGNRVVVTAIKPGLSPAITIGQSGGARIGIVVLTQQQAESSWKIESGTRQHLLVSAAQFYADKQAVFLEDDGGDHIAFTITPPLARHLESSVQLKEDHGVAGTTYSATLPLVRAVPTVKQVSQAGVAQPVRLGPAASWRKGVAVAPDDSAFAAAAKWRIAIPTSAWQNADDLFLDIRYRGDVARLTSNGKLLTDNFYNGEPWPIGLTRFRDQITEHGLELEILPLRADAPIFLERPYRTTGGTGQALSLESVRIVPRYRLQIDIPR